MKTKIVFMGTPDYATEIFKALIAQSDFEVSLVITQEDKPVGRKMQLSPPHIKAYIQKNGIITDIYQPKTLKTQEAYETIKQREPDFIVVAAYGQILPKEILDIAPCINLHASILPNYRGASPIQATILHNEIYAGVTAMKMAEGLDTGDMLCFSYYKLDEKIEIAELFERLSHLAAKLCVKTLQNYQRLKPIEQKECFASYAKKITKEDGLIDFEDSLESYTKYRTYNGWPGAYLQNGLKIKKMEHIENNSLNTKAIIADIEKKSVVVSCKKGTLRLHIVQLPSKKAVDGASFAHGRRLEIGDSIL